MAKFKTGDVHPAAHLKEGLASNRLTYDTAAVCLIAYRAALVPLSRPRRARAMERDALGGRTLHWLWADEQRWTHAVQHDPKFFDSLGQLLVAEGRIQYLLDFLRVDRPAQIPLPGHWRGRLFRAAIKSQLFETLGTSADATLDTLLQTDQHVSAERQN